MNLPDLRSLDFEDPGGWPGSAKVMAAIAVVIAIIAVGYFLVISDKQDEVESAQAQERRLFQEFETKYKKSANLEEYRAQLEQMEKDLGVLLDQLPSKTEMPQLLQGISSNALEAGIRIDLFRPEQEIIKDIYAERPISLKMQGGYHEFGRFVSDVAALGENVILTMHDISLKPEELNSNQLVLQGTVRTYRALDEAEQVEVDAAAGAR